MKIIEANLRGFRRVSYIEIIYFFNLNIETIIKKNKNT